MTKLGPQILHERKRPSRNDDNCLIWKQASDPATCSRDTVGFSCRSKSQYAVRFSY
jgi:hypothetical protein